MSNTSMSRNLAVSTPHAQDRSGYAREAQYGGLSEATWRYIFGASMIVLGAVSWAWSAGLGPSLPVSDCQTSPSPVVFSPDTEITLIARRGASCPIFVRRTVAMVDRLNVTVVPRNGIVTPRGGTGVVYRPNKDFKGEDFFAFAMRVQLSNYVGTSLVRVRVTVN